MYTFPHTAIPLLAIYFFKIAYVSDIVSSGLNVPANVKDSLDEALLVAEGLPAQAAEALKAAGRSAFDQSFFVIIAGVTAFLVLASLIVLLAGGRSKKREVADE